MIQNYLKITLRNLNKRRAYTSINVIGLAVGMAVCLVIGKYIEFETSYDGFHEKAKNLYRVISSFHTDGTIEEYNGYDLGPSLLRGFPEVKSFARIHGNGSVVSFTDQSGKQVRFKESKLLIVDSTFLRIFSFKAIRGNISSSLNRPNSIVITESIALKYFGREVNPIGRIMDVSDGWIPGLYEVTAVLEDAPANTHFEFEFLMPMHNLLQTVFYRGQNSRWDNFHTYLEIHERADLQKLENKIPQFVRDYIGNDKALNAQSTLKFQNILDIHYSPNPEKSGSYLITLYCFAAIAMFVLAIAWMNYINLATASAMERAREVGVKKAIGVSRTQLIAQFIFESVLVNFMSVLLAAGVAMLLLPLLNDITGRSFGFNFAEPRLLTVLILLFVSGSFASGIYPAFVLSSFKTTEVIKGKIAHTARGFSLRNGLVGFQFTASLLLLVGTFVIYRQVSFMQSQEKGFDIQRTVIVKGPELTEEKGLAERMISFKNELLQFSFIEKVSTSYSVPGTEAITSTGMRKLGLPLEENKIGNMYWVDPDFIELYNIPFIAGKTWNPEMNSDMAVIVNEEAVKQFELGTSETALGEKLVLPFDTCTVLGVVKNHHWNSMKQPYSPMIFRFEKISPKNISIRIKGNIHEALEQVEKKYKADFPGNDFSYYFLDDFYNSRYQMEQQFGKLFSMFSVLAALIGCLGLWGLASFTTIHRIKEISIRKVLGASVNSILLLLMKQFLKPLFISSLIALPLVWLGVTEWLKQFPYRISLSIELLLWPLVILSGVALLTISVQTVRAALSNPVNSLKNE